MRCAAVYYTTVVWRREIGYFGHIIAALQHHRTEVVDVQACPSFQVLQLQGSHFRRTIQPTYLHFSHYMKASFHLNSTVLKPG